MHIGKSMAIAGVHRWDASLTAAASVGASDAWRQAQRLQDSGAIGKV